MLAEVFLLLWALVLIWYYVTRLPDTYPATPPIRIPILGHTLYMLGYKNSQEAFNELCKKYAKDGMMVSIC